MSGSRCRIYRRAAHAWRSCASGLCRLACSAGTLWRGSARARPCFVCSGQRSRFVCSGQRSLPEVRQVRKRDMETVSVGQISEDRSSWEDSCCCPDAALSMSAHDLHRLRLQLTTRENCAAANKVYKELCTISVCHTQRLRMVQGQSYCLGQDHNDRSRP